MSDPTSKKSPTSPKDVSKKSKDSSHKSDYEREENWIVDDIEGGYDENEEEEESDEGNGAPLPIQKTTSMANFYYKRSRSSDEILHTLEKNAPS